MPVTSSELLIKFLMVNTVIWAAPIQLCMLSSYREVSYVQDTATAILQQIDDVPGKYSLKIVTTDDVALPESLQSYAIQMTDRLYATGSDCETGEDTDPLPPCKVRQQSLDVVVGLRRCQAASGGGGWIVLMEDDFKPCPNAMREMASVLLGQLDQPGTKFARFTQGGGVVAFPADKVLLYAESLMSQVEYKPCDWVLTGQWDSGQDYVHPVFLFKHIGGVSTIQYRNKEDYRRAYSWLRDNECSDTVKI